MDNFLNQVFEESRYHRRFHHTIFVLAVTLYSGLLAIQLTNTISINNLFLKWLIPVGVGVLLPLYFIYLIFSYHATIAKLNSVIFELGSSIVSKISAENLGRLNSTSPLVNSLLFKKYADAVHDERDLRFVGRGHWFFSGVVVLLVAMNAAAYFCKP